MSPANRIWAFSLLILFIVVLILIFRGAEPGPILVIFLLVSIGSLGSLLGFYLLFEGLHSLHLRLPLHWAFALIGVSLVVCCNSFVFLSLISLPFDSYGDVISLFAEMSPFTAVTVGAAWIGTGLSYKRINAAHAYHKTTTY